MAVSKIAGTFHTITEFMRNGFSIEDMIGVVPKRRQKVALPKICGIYWSLQNASIALTLQSVEGILSQS